MEIFIICVVAGAVIGGLAGFLIARRKNKKSSGSEATAGKVKVVDGVRYSESAGIEDSAGNVSVTHNEGDVVLAAGKTYKAEKGGLAYAGEIYGAFGARRSGFVQYTYRRLCARV